MDESTRTILEQARDLLRAGQAQEARKLLVGALKSNPDSEHAWYLLGFTLDDPAKKRYAFEQALRINPQYQKARKQLAALETAGDLPEAEQAAPAIDSQPPSTPIFLMDEPKIQQIQPEEAVVFEDQPEEAEKTDYGKSLAPGRLRAIGCLVVSGVSLLAVLVIAVVLALSGRLPLPGVVGAGPTSAAVLSTATAAPTGTATLAPATPTSGSPTEPLRAYNAAFEAANCEFKIPEDATVECGYIVVPEARAGDSVNAVRLAVAIYRSQSDTPAPDPVIFLQGGPGSEGIKFAAETYDYYVKPILAERDFITFDQRGVGMSKPSLACQELEDLHLQHLGQSVTETELGPQYIQAFDQCRDRLAIMGLDLSAYTTDNVAADIKDMVDVLGYERANLFGISYGTRLALAVMRDYPEIVRSAVLDSPVPLEARMFNDLAVRTDGSLRAMFADCAADPACSAVFPDLEVVFYQLVEQLDAQPVAVKVSHPITGAPYDIEVDSTGLISAISWGLRISQLAPDMPQTIYDIRDGDYAYLGALLSDNTVFYADLSMGMYTSMSCHEQVYATSPEELAADLAVFPPLEAFAHSVIYGSPENLFNICETWGAAPFAAAGNQPLVSSLPTLILAGEYDPATPPIYGAQIDASLLSSYFVEIPGQGHSLSTSAIDSCPMDIALAFMRNPDAAPDTACVAEMGAPWFVIPYSGAEKIEFTAFSNSEFGLQGVVPADWLDYGSGFYLRANSLLDPTQIGIQSMSASSDRLLDWLTRNFLEFGFDEQAQHTGSHQANGLNWNLYLAKARGNRVDLALAQRRNRTLMVLFVSKARERDALYQDVFLPVLNSVEPLR